MPRSIGNAALGENRAQQLPRDLGFLETGVLRSIKIENAGRREGYLFLTQFRNEVMVDN